MDTLPSLNPKSEQKYWPAQLRVNNDQGIRLQIGSPIKAEWDIPVSDKLRAWVASLTPTVKSVMGTNTLYVLCQVRIEQGPAPKVRVQVPGPEYNRPYGAVFIVEWLSLHKALQSLGQHLAPPPS